MYYYIFEPVLQANEYERVTKIKELLSTLGIAGEMVSPTPGRTLEDLVELAIAKRYSTVVAVGGSELINRVARALEPHDAVLGIIPLQENPDISRLIGATDWKEAATQLKRRRWQPVKLGLINQELCFLTPATIELTPDNHYSLKTPTFTATGSGGTMEIVRTQTDGEETAFKVTIRTIAPKSGLFGGLFKKQATGPASSEFTVTELQLDTNVAASAVVAGTAVCSTPISCTTQEKPVKLIVGKGGQPTS